jgi:hypothetical protein
LMLWESTSSPFVQNCEPPVGSRTLNFVGTDKIIEKVQCYWLGHKSAEQA